MIFDTKLTCILTGSRFRVEILRSGYLYQKYTYLRTQEQASDPFNLAAEGSQTSRPETCPVAMLLFHSTFPDH
jgi:hypothetical protein